MKLPDNSRATLFTYNSGGDFRESRVPLVFRWMREVAPYSLDVVVGVDGSDSQVQLSRVSVTDSVGTRQILPHRTFSESGWNPRKEAEAIHRHGFSIPDVLRSVGPARVAVTGKVRRAGGDWQPFSIVHENDAARTRYLSTGWINLIVFGEL